MNPSLTVTELALIIAIFQVSALLLLVATVLRCHGDDDADKKLSKCRETCDIVYGYSCVKGCEFIPSETADDITRCRQLCHLEMVECLIDCKPWWEDWW